MTHNERCQRAVNLLLNQLLRLPRNKAPREYRAVTALETFTEAPAFSLLSKRDLIEKAYAIHHLPSPYDLDAWPDSALPAQVSRETSAPV